MLQSTQPNRKGVGANSRPSAKERIRTLQERQSKGADSRRPSAFSPDGRHGLLRGLLLSVGNVLARDESGSLSRVSLSELRRGLSDFLTASRLDEKEFLEGGTRRSGAKAASSNGSVIGEQERRVIQMKRKASDEMVAQRLRASKELSDAV